MEFKLFIPKSITRAFFDTKLSRFGLVGLPMVAIFDFQMSICQLFEKLQGSNSEFKLITPKSITGSYFEITLSRFGLVGLPMVAILDF